MTTDRLTIRVDDELQKQLAMVAHATGKTESQVVRDALRDYIARHGHVQTCYDVARAAGLIGCVKGGPTDVSTNPKYMEGFGRD